MRMSRWLRAYIEGMSRLKRLLDGYGNVLKLLMTHYRYVLKLPVDTMIQYGVEYFYILRKNSIILDCKFPNTTCLLIYTSIACLYANLTSVLGIRKHSSPSPSLLWSFLFFPLFLSYRRCLRVGIG